MTIQNKQLLRDALDFARRSAAGEEILVNGIKSQWDQRVYTSLLDKQVEEAADLQTCGTAYCIAGYIVARHPTYEAQLASTRHRIHLEAKINGEPISGYGNIAIRMFGVDLFSEKGDHFRRLFSGENTLEDVERIGAELLGEDD